MNEPTHIEKLAASAMVKSAKRGLPKWLGSAGPAKWPGAAKPVEKNLEGFLGGLLKRLGSVGPAKWPGAAKPVEKNLEGFLGGLGTGMRNGKWLLPTPTGVGELVGNTAAGFMGSKGRGYGALAGALGKGAVLPAAGTAALLSARQSGGEVPPPMEGVSLGPEKSWGDWITAKNMGLLAAGGAALGLGAYGASRLMGDEEEDAEGMVT